MLFLDSNQHTDGYSQYDLILAADAFTSLSTDYHQAFSDLRSYKETTADWLFGYLSYDLKNDLEELRSENHDGLVFPDLFFFQPKKLFLIRDNQVHLHYLNICADEIQSDISSIESIDVHAIGDSRNDALAIHARIEKTSYVEKVGEMKRQIGLGNIYEANFCMEFYCENALINPVEIYQKLNSISTPPFAAFLKMNQHYALCASPERYLAKRDDLLISQPIKGTSKRFTDPDADLQSANALRQSEKERAENIMIVDLVRNDLSKTAKKGTVQVTELCGIHSFRQVHQMISTVTSQLSEEYSAIDVIAGSFPMGSMTGAPKVSAMNIIEELEESKRGLYSGAIGYFTPEGNFDFNVVIRSILYNHQNKYLSFSVGSAITSLSETEAEYDECLLKAAAMFNVLR